MGANCRVSRKLVSTILGRSSFFFSLFFFSDAPKNELSPGRSMTRWRGPQLRLGRATDTSLASLQPFFPVSVWTYIYIYTCLTITTSTHVQARWILRALDNVATWAQMQFKPRKSKCMVIRDARVTSKFQLHVQGEAITSIKESPIKCLEKWYDASLTDKNNASNRETGR